MNGSIVRLIGNNSGSELEDRLYAAIFSGDDHEKHRAEAASNGVLEFNSGHKVPPAVFLPVTGKTRFVAEAERKRLGVWHFLKTPPDSSHR